ncbi:alpha/beta fold hydrolase [Telluribacter sp. SYSU D00476]|uniref:alpha/beta fold hydrolase n=1 Tax=Telluribacter sp. SYSU D00476 TaxID=2811430 RepID=UPI001FF32B20|nr:alpha/beta fold hydrolase [Telluribacter sp. SYSU D00476]
MKFIKSLSLYILLLFVPVFFTSCFSKYRTTAREVRRHYANKEVKPTVKCIENDTICVQVATVGADTLPMLLLIHGAPGAWWGYMNLLDDPDLQKRFHIVSVDRLGYGKSRWKKQRHVTSIEMHARSLLPVLKLNKSKEKVIVLGRSYGAPIAAHLTVLASEEVKQLIMVAPVIDPDRERFYWFSKWGNNRLVQLFLPREFNAATAEKYSHAAELRRMVPIWQNLTVPTTVIQGGNDWIADPANIEFAKKHIPSTQAQYIFLPKAGHMITHSHKDMIKEMILKSSMYVDRNITVDFASGR